MQNFTQILQQNLAQNAPIEAIGYGVTSKDSKFSKMTFSRHKMGANDIVLEILYAGICHSDIHSVRSEWREGIYPMVPGHEIAGRVVAVGKDVRKFKIGDYAGVGCMVNSCGECDACERSQEQFCSNCVFTYNAIDCYHNNIVTYGGYSNNIVVSENFAVCVPENAPLDKVAPLLCAGITTYSPLKFSNIKKGDVVGVAGFGGLGMMALKYAVAFGAEVHIFARNKNKEKEALQMGAKSLNDSTNVSTRFDLILSTIPTAYDPLDYIKLLKFGGELALVGIPPAEISPKIDISSLIHGLAGRKVYGSLIGGIKETQEMLDFSLAHKIYPETQIISVSQIDEAYANLTTGKAKFRYVIDMQTLEG